jgi:glyoxylase-like metal-dependent hydrolase (beta-lactamase superfamily II)
MGDIYFNGLYPYIDVNSGGNIDGMIRAVNKGLELTDSASAIIPGHGPVANREEMKKYLSMLQTIRARIRPLVIQGRSLKDVQKEKPTAEFDARWGGKFLTPDQFVEIVYNGMLPSSR